MAQLARLTTYLQNHGQLLEVGNKKDAASRHTGGNRWVQVLLGKGLPLRSAPRCSHPLRPLPMRQKFDGWFRTTAGRACVGV